MPLAGGLPVRHTFEGGTVVGWTPQGRVLFTTTVYSTLPKPQLMTVDPASGASELLPLAQASDGVYDDAGRTLFFTRLAFQGSQTKRYKGGTAQNLCASRVGCGGPAAHGGLRRDEPAGDVVEGAGVLRDRPRWVNCFGRYHQCRIVLTKC